MRYHINSLKGVEGNKNYFTYMKNWLIVINPKAVNIFTNLNKRLINAMIKELGVNQ